jgi:pyruvate formate lyase activating enzyme
MLIAGFQKSTLLDYPGKVAAMIFTYGCNLRCVYCHNPELVIEPCVKESLFSTEDVLSLLKKRKGVLDALVITGGEPTLHNDLESFILDVKCLGYLVKLDTNGTNPGIIERFNTLGIVDYWAMDIKYEEELYLQNLKSKIAYSDIKKSIGLIMDSGKEYEFRTTYVKGIHTIDSARGIGELIKGSKNYFIQNFRPGKTIDSNLDRRNSFTPLELKKMKGAIAPFVENVYIRE